ELWPVEQFGARLSSRRPDEDGPLAKAGDEVRQAVGDASVEMPHGGEVLHARQCLLRGQRLMRWSHRYEAFGVHSLHALGTLEIEEVGESGLAERKEIELDARWEVSRALRKVRAGDRRGGADRRHQVGDQREVQHLIHADAVQDTAPLTDRVDLRLREPFVDA